MNARGFVLALLLLVGIAAAHVIWACVSIGVAARAEAARYEAASLFDDAELSLREFVLNGQPSSLERLENSRNRLRDLCNSNDELEEWRHWEQRWYSTFAQPLIQERQKVDAEQTTFSQLQVRYFQLNADRETWGSRTITLKSGETLTLTITPKDRLEFGRGKFIRQAALHSVIAVMICFAGLLTAVFGLRHISSLGKQQA